MKRAVITGICLMVIAVVMTRGVVVNILLSLILAGSVPGTTIVIPFWVMMAFYCTVASLIIAWYTGSLIVEHRMRKSSAKQRMPRRRYSHI